MSPSQLESVPSTAGHCPHSKPVPGGLTHCPNTIFTPGPAATGVWGALAATAGKLWRARPEHSSQRSFLGNKAFPFTSHRNREM